jgi:hypothetical protein
MQADASPFGSMGCQRGSSSMKQQKLAQNIDAIERLKTEALEMQADASRPGSTGRLGLHRAQGRHENIEAIERLKRDALVMLQCKSTRATTLVP